MRSELLKGYFYTIFAGMLWGLSDSCGQYAFSHSELTTVWLTVIRMIVAGTLLTAYNLFFHREKSKGIWKEKRDALQLVAFGILGLMLSQYTTFQAIRFTNAGTATVLQSLSPAIILIFTCLVMRKMPRKIEAFAVCLAFTGTFLLATHGNPTTMVLSGVGLLWGLLSASSAAGYTLLSCRIAAKWGTMIVMGQGLLIGGIVLALLTQVWTQPLSLPWDSWLAVGGTVFFGTLFAYTFYVTGCTIIGPVKGSMLATMEPLTATILAVFWLGSSFKFIDFVGFACILLTVLLLTGKKEEA